MLGINKTLAKFVFLIVVEYILKIAKMVLYCPVDITAWLTASKLHLVIAKMVYYFPVEIIVWPTCKWYIATLVPSFSKDLAKNHINIMVKLLETSIFRRTRSKKWNFVIKLVLFRRIRRIRKKVGTDQIKLLLFLLLKLKKSKFTIKLIQTSTFSTSFTN